MSNFAKSTHANPPLPTNVKHDNKAKLIGKRVEVSKSNSTSMYTMRSGRISKPTKRLIAQM